MGGIFTPQNGAHRGSNGSRNDNDNIDYFCKACIIHKNQIGLEFEKLNVLLRRDICSFVHYAKQIIS